MIAPNSLRQIAENKLINLRYFTDEKHVGISLDETTTTSDVVDLIHLFAEHGGHGVVDLQWTEEETDVTTNWPDHIVRTSPFLTQEVFEKYHSEHELLRYLKRLENKDLSLGSFDDILRLLYNETQCHD